MFLKIKTKLNIAFAISIASCFIKNPSYQYTRVLKTILKYIESSKHCKITYNGQEKLLVKKYSKLNQAKDVNSKKSTFGFVFILNSSLIS